MKLDELLTRDTMSIDLSEWLCYLDLGPLKGAMQCDLVDGTLLPDGNVHVRFEYRAPIALTFIGYRVMRVWVDDVGSPVVRTVRSDVWTPAFVALAGALIEIDVIVEPRDWA